MTSWAPLLRYIQMETGKVTSSIFYCGNMAVWEVHVHMLCVAAACSLDFFKGLIRHKLR